MKKYIKSLFIWQVTGGSVFFYYEYKPENMENKQYKTFNENFKLGLQRRIVFSISGVGRLNIQEAKRYP